VGLGDAWLTTGRTLALQVPSALIPEEPNFVLNPAHAAMSQLHIGEPKVFHFDARL
jgi:RES domain-containing protein